jgi:Spy/CpxP family protein refolding chaperone
MKKIFASMLAVVIAFSAVAQNGNKNAKGKRGEEMGQRRGPEQVKRQGMIGGVGSLNLTDAQKQQMKQVNESFRQQMQELNKNENITVKEQKERRAALTQQHKTDVQNILTAEQRRELEANKKDYKSKDKDYNKGRGDDMMGRGDKNGRDDSRGDNLKQLNLTDAQGVRIKAANEEFRTKVQAIQKNASLSNDQKKTQRDAAQQQHTAAIKAILTQEQTAKLEELKRTRPDRKGKK